ncbi:MAG: magnesium chelatase [Verrucomicrobia bacterium]|nr:magnesium chelatase [Verrucomicrobiota bacterium]|tara:strand:+ start:185 stop:1666 length:1482 start_codon:yes stop_codon:yes gene_type:complete
MKNYQKIKTFGDLKKANYQSKSIKDELRDNLIAKIQTGETVFEEIYGYEDSVIPSIERAILSRHSINLLGLRGQAKTKIARILVRLLDDVIPIIEGSEVNDDPFLPVSKYGKEKIATEGDKTPISWVQPEQRYIEKLATPDVSIADLIGDVDPIKAANMKLSYADERVIHFGLIPRSNRCIFVINELPDLQARIQVALFNILQEGDIQIRGFQLRFPLDIQFLFTANPEDYTNRGSIISPLKDRIQSQIMTHYPLDIETSKKITQSQAKLHKDQDAKIDVPELVKDLLEQITVEARRSNYVDEKSGVSARLSISAFETLLSSAERRMLINNEQTAVVRVSDLISVIPAIIGKIEMVYEGEQEGAVGVSFALIREAIRNQAINFFPELKDLKKSTTSEAELFRSVVQWFSTNSLDLLNDLSTNEYKKRLNLVDGLTPLIKKKYGHLSLKGQLLMMEYLLHALAEYSYISKTHLDSSIEFGDLLSSYINTNEESY